MFFKTYRLKKQLERKRLDFEMEQLNLATDIMSKEARLVADDPDEADWIQLGSSNSTTTSAIGYDHYTMLEKAFFAYHTDLFARAIVRNLSKFVLGKGPIIKALDKNKVVQECWDTFVEENRWSLREKEMVMRVFRDGEVFMRKYPDTRTGMLRLRFLRADRIRTPLRAGSVPGLSLGIQTDPDDIENVLFYYLCDAKGELRARIPADEIIHIKILADSDMKRGISFLLTAMPMIKKYLGWLEDRIVLNKIRSAIALVRKVEGTKATVDSIRSNYQSETVSADRNKQKAFPRGTVLTATKGLSYDMLSPNINAQDVKDDGRAMLLAVAAGCGMPEMILTADYSNANYSSSMVAQNPFVREVEDWQDFFSYYYKTIFREVVETAIQYGKVPEGVSKKCSIEWPPLILADIKKNNEAREIQFRNKVLSRKTWQLKEGLDPDVERQNLIEEENDEVYQAPFNLPQVPTNQYG